MDSCLECFKLEAWLSCICCVAYFTNKEVQTHKSPLSIIIPNNMLENQNRVIK